MVKSRKTTREQPAPSADCVLCLYVNGTTPRSRLAIANVRALCSEHLSDQHELMVIDICRHPRVAMDEQIVALPTLLRKWPLPERRVIGDLSNEQKVLAALDLQPCLA